MPVHETEGGYKYGNTGKTYKDKKSAIKQAIAIAYSKAAKKGRKPTQEEIEAEIRGTPDELEKTAGITTKLQPHQERAVKKALAHNLVLAHSMGSGKTLTAIAIAEALGKPTTALVPAPTVENFKKQLEEHRDGGVPFDVISLPTAVSRRMAIPKGNTVILDEAHAFRNPSQRQAYIHKILGNAGRVVALTGTPAYNKKEDWPPLVNLLSEKPILESLDPFIRTRKVYPGFLAAMRGVKPGVVEELKNTDKLHKLLSPYVDVYSSNAEMPERINEDKFVPMSQHQRELYTFVRNRMPLSLAYKLERNLPPSKSEAAQLNAFLSGVRQVSNTTQAFSKDTLPLAELEKDSPKLKMAADDIKKLLDKNPNARAFVYSNYLDAGVIPLARMLAARNIKYGIFNGSLSSKARSKLVDDYNAGNLPVLLGTGAASEGLNLKQTSLVGVLEPHWNNSRIEQAIARGIRYKSHADLPEDQRKVKVNRYYATLETPKNWWDKLWGSKDPTSVDQYLKTMSEDKDKMMRAILDAVK